MKPNHGGSAFPGGDHIEPFHAQNGLLLRDYFAAAALTALLSRDGTPREAAEAAYMFADAMLAKREEETK